MYYSLSLLFLYFFIYAVLGWCCEVVYCSIPAKKFINRGFLNGPYCPIYGVGAVIIVGVLAPYINHPISVFCVGLVLTSFLEYVTSWGMEKLFHAKWWDYSSYPFNLNGRICLKNSVFFGILCLIVMYLIHPPIAHLLTRFSSLQIEIIASVLMVLMLVDLVLSTLETINFKEKIARVSDLAADLTSELREKGISTKAELTERLANAKAVPLDVLMAARANAEDIRGDIQKSLNAFNGKILENAYHRYSHHRIVNAFPGMIHRDDHESLKLYQAALDRSKKSRRLTRRLKKEKNS